MNDLTQNSAADAIAEQILTRRNELLAAREELAEERAKLLARQRRVDRELADCRAAARFFGLEIEFPSQEIERDDLTSERLAAQERLLQRARDAHARAEFMRRQAEQEKQALEYQIKNFRGGSREARPASGSDLRPEEQLPPPSIAVAAAVPSAKRRQTLREFCLDQLKGSAPLGMKAAQIRELYERSNNKIIHEKTVGMTLYRLLNDERLVRREGHIWFLAPPKVETENPGGDTPGPDNAQ